MPNNAALAADALAPNVRVVGVALNRHQGDTEETYAAGLATTCDCPFRRHPESPLDWRAAHPRLVESLPAARTDGGEPPL